MEVISRFKLWMNVPKTWRLLVAAQRVSVCSWAVPLGLFSCSGLQKGEVFSVALGLFHERFGTASASR